MKYVQFVLDDITNKKLEEVIRNSGKSKQNYFENLVKEIIKKSGVKK